MRNFKIVRENPEEFERINNFLKGEYNDEVETLIIEIGYLKELNSIANDLNESYRKRIEYLESGE